MCERIFKCIKKEISSDTNGRFEKSFLASSDRGVGQDHLSNTVIRIIRSAMAPEARNPLNSNLGSTLLKAYPLGSPEPVVSITNVATEAKES